MIIGDLGLGMGDLEDLEVSPADCCGARVFTKIPENKSWSYKFNRGICFSQHEMPPPAGKIYSRYALKNGSETLNIWINHYNKYCDRNKTPDPTAPSNLGTLKDNAITEIVVPTKEPLPVLFFTIHSHSYIRPGNTRSRWIIESHKTATDRVTISTNERIRRFTTHKQILLTTIAIPGLLAYKDRLLDTIWGLKDNWKYNDFPRGQNANYPDTYPILMLEFRLVDVPLTVVDYDLP